MEHDIITRNVYSVSGAEIWEFSKPQRDIIIIIIIKSEVKLKLCLIFKNFQNGRHFEPDKLFYRELYRKLNIPER